MLNVVIFGPPGAGKGTQSEKLIEKYGFVHISTGDMFRAHIKNQTPLGKKVIEYTDNGLLVPDSITIDMLQEEVNNNPQAKGFLFDGFPRTVPQAEALDALMEKNGSAIHAVVALEVTEEEVRGRIRKRREVSQRADDEDEKVNKRIDEYFNKTIHVLPFYEQQGRLERVNGIGDIDEIFENICKALA
ncbi:MAG: adenylate kinase [Microscillaceae bacterium]|jgi:adenylate kinase|nr:adenylate kinase [Microscillaceae bacterium]